ncbi:hypothetical protein [Streptomyces sp. NPDC093544]|uniref:hypothetical protein n=1 Tax=Streptomyces sp. NPDC093544 TaxID=3155200 RepID=UPI003425494C
MVEQYADHQGITPQNIQDALTAIAALDHDGGRVVRLTDSYGIVQLGIRVGADDSDAHIAAVLHLPDRLADPTTLLRGETGLGDLAARLSSRG